MLKEKLSNAISERSNRTKLLSGAWLYLQKLIEINSDEIEQWTTFTIKHTLESMLMVFTSIIEKK